VADTGNGIAPEHLSRIFEPFFTTKAYGTGLGLTNVKRLVEDNGGTLVVNSNAGAGTSFTLRFRAAG
jgi:two-component system sensor histidine kinase AtoS